MHMLEDTIVAISPEREKFFGCSGRMLLPCPATVAAAIKEIPHGRVTTLDALRNALAQRAGVDVACPFQTKQAVLAIASQSGTVPYWRLVKKNGDVLKYLPGGAQNHAARLAEEGVGTEQTVHGTRVKDLKNKLHAFDSDAV